MKCLEKIMEAQRNDHMIATFRGQRLENFTKEELIAIITWQVKQSEKDREERMRQARFSGELMKRAASVF